MPTLLPQIVGDQIIALQAGDMFAAEQFAATAAPWLLDRVKNVCPDLARAGLADDVVQETYCLLLCRPAGHFQPERADASTYLFLQLREAGNKVRAMHALPGWTVRREQAKQDEPLPEHIYLDAGDEQRELLELAIGRDGRPDVEEQVLVNVCLGQFLRSLAPEDAWAGEVVEGVLDGARSLDNLQVAGRSRFAVRRRARNCRSAMVAAGLLAA